MPSTAHAQLMSEHVVRPLLRRADHAAVGAEFKPPPEEFGKVSE